MNSWKYPASNTCVLAFWKKEEDVTERKYLFEEGRQEKTK